MLAKIKKKKFLNILDFGITLTIDFKIILCYFSLLLVNNLINFEEGGNTMKKKKIVAGIEAETNFLITKHAIEREKAEEILRSINNFLKKKNNTKSIAIFLSNRLKLFFKEIGCTEDEMNVHIKVLKIKLFPFIYEERIKTAKKKILLKCGQKRTYILNDLRRNDNAFFNVCKKSLKDNTGKIDLRLLSKYFEMNFAPAYGRTVRSVTAKILAKLEQRQPQTFNGKWIKTNAASEHDFLQKNLRNENNINWQIFVDALPKKWQTRWRYNKFTNFNLYVALKKLRIHLEGQNPDYFNVRYLFLHVTDVWSYIYRTHKRLADDKTDWVLLISNLPVKWQYRWVSDTENFSVASEGKYIFESAIDALNILLDEEKLQHSSPEVIKQKNLKLYNFFVKKVRGVNGNVNWRLVRSCLNEENKRRFHLPQATEHSMPEKFYKNKTELEMLIHKKDLKLHTLFSIANDENRVLANEVCVEIVSLAQVGNLEAYDLIFEYLEQITAFWVINNEKLRVLEYFREDLDKMIRRCIYKYSPKVNKSFLGYLFNAATHKAREMEYVKNREISLEDRGYYGTSLSNHEKISSLV